MSASEPRASSAVRNLRSLFENKQSSVDAASSGSPTPRGRSPFGSFDHNSGLRPTSKVRASFISVEPPVKMATAIGGGDGAMDVAGEVEQSVPSPDVNGDDNVVYQPPENPDKPVMGAEEDMLAMTPADPTSKDTVSGGDALPPKVEDLRSSKIGTTKTGSSRSGPKPINVATKPASKASVASVKSPASQPKTPTSSTRLEAPAAKPMPTKKSSRSSLTAPTAASMARAGAAAEKAKTSPVPNPKPKEVTKPVNLPSHLTAPTAASKARQELTKESLSASTSTRVKPAASTATTRPGPRTSLAPRQRTDSQSSETSTQRRKPAAPASGSFLERMTKPTAASQNRHQDKPEARSPPRSKAAAPTQKPKANGKPAQQSTPKPDASATPAVDDETPVHDTEAEDKPAIEASPDDSDSPPALETQAERHAPADDEHQGEHTPPTENTKAEPPAEESSDTLKPASKLQAAELPAEPKPEALAPPTESTTKSAPDAAKSSETNTTGSETPQHHQLPNGNSPTMESTPAALNADETIR